MLHVDCRYKSLKHSNNFRKSERYRYSFKFWGVLMFSKFYYMVWVIVTRRLLKFALVPKLRTAYEVFVYIGYYSPTIPTYRDKRNWKKSRRQKGIEQPRPMKKQWPSSWNPPVPHHRIQGQQDHSTENGGIKALWYARFYCEAAHICKYTDVQPEHRA